MKKKILLVDDDPGVCRMLQRVLEEEGYLVVPAANGLEALERAQATAPHLVLLDLNLPVQNGWDTLERLAAEDPLLPVIIITARPNQLFPALASGAGALMEKPLDLAKLLRTIRELLAEPAEARLARMAGKRAAAGGQTRGEARWLVGKNCFPSRTCAPADVGSNRGAFLWNGGARRASCAPSRFSLRALRALGSLRVGRARFGCG
jgi:DNA-binding response OmpR family regulator